VKPLQAKFDCTLLSFKRVPESIRFMREEREDKHMES
jgi:hypothetical protein